MNDFMISDSNSGSYTPTEPQEYILGLQAENPLCIANFEEVLVIDLLQGDANADGTVNVIDIVLVSSYFGYSGNLFGSGDTNGDNVVDILDLLETSSNFGSSCE